MNFEKIVDAYIAGSPHRKALNKKEFDFLRRQAYPSVRHGFRPAAYVVLTREETVGSEGAHA